MLVRRGRNIFRRWLLCGKVSHSIARSRHRCVLGIETSCDDTGAAVVDELGNVLGEALFSQEQIHVRHGGIIPPIAKALHAKHISTVVTDALQRSSIRVQELDAIATTVKPGIAISLAVGMKYGKMLSKQFDVPFIPIHHMEAHALTIRMTENVPFPFLVLLISGGHCLIAVARGVDDFLLLGRCMDDAPGEAFDKTARRLKLTNIPEYANMNGGCAMEHAARKGNPLAFDLTVPMNRRRDCNFSFSGIKYGVLKRLLLEEAKYGVEADGVLPNVADICASFQLAVARHLMKRVQRAVKFCEVTRLLPEDKKILVVSGGVACNGFIRSALQQLCDMLTVHMLCPPPMLCTDNGIMIAWNGIERLRSNCGIVEQLDTVDIQAQCPLGVDITHEVLAANLKMPLFKMNFKTL